MVDDIGIPTDFAEPSPPSGAILCAEPECEVWFTPTGPGSAFRKYCDEHKPAPKKGKKKADRRPTNVTVNIGPKTPTKTKDLEAVREKAEWLVSIVAMLTTMAGSEEDAADLLNGKAAWADAVKTLAAHEEWLRKLASGGETSERAMAWVGFLFATGVMLFPILVRHKIIPENLAAVATAAIPVVEPEPAAA